jgi:hypothetical protein
VSNKLHAEIALWIKASCNTVKTSADLNSIFLAATPEKQESLGQGIRTTKNFAIRRLFWYVHIQYFAAVVRRTGTIHGAGLGRYFGSDSADFKFHNHELK